MNRSLIHEPTVAGRGLYPSSPRGRCGVASTSIFRLALLLYLSPIIVLVFAIGGAGILLEGAIRWLIAIAGSFQDRPPSSRRLASVAVSARMPGRPRAINLPGGSRRIGRD